MFARLRATNRSHDHVEDDRLRLVCPLDGHVSHICLIGFGKEVKASRSPQRTRGLHCPDDAPSNSILRPKGAIWAGSATTKGKQRLSVIRMPLSPISNFYLPICPSNKYGPLTVLRFLLNRQGISSSRSPKKELTLASQYKALEKVVA